MHCTGTTGLSGVTLEIARFLVRWQTPPGMDTIMCALPPSPDRWTITG